ncbi:MAG: hypothetical protein IJR20_06350 [Muribaculaceae bacterium]|nr:hypothetical protein [Muribaculaceae bacterium]MBQ9585600.1 hypothetical protein [Muribaculaceae bacterium]
MKKEDSKILEKLGKDPGFKVPDNYFNDFNSKLMESLPEVKITEEEKPTLWIKVRPFVYMAAMFAGIWLMMNIFNIGQKATGRPEAKIKENVIKNDNQPKTGLQDNAIMNYEDSVNANLEKAKSIAK